MLSQTVEYALRAIVTIAQNAGRVCTAREIAEATRVPPSYLPKLLQALARGGIVSGHRGPHGGFQLLRDPQELTLWHVVSAIEPFQRIHECPLGIRSHTGQLCPLHSSLDHAMATMEQLFRQMTVGQMLQQPGRVTPLCEGAPQPLVQLGGIGLSEHAPVNSTVAAPVGPGINLPSEDVR
ncbi:MAG: RrF2 family transcriptional regulator [Planctomycetota bacterium]